MAGEGCAVAVTTPVLLSFSAHRLAGPGRAGAADVAGKCTTRRDPAKEIKTYF